MSKFYQFSLGSNLLYTFVGGVARLYGRLESECQHKESTAAK